ncbi:MAG: MBL fold metallo-hydrolase [Clostridia bacterium]
MKIQLIRHATLLVTFHGQTLIVDPMLSDKGTMPAVFNTANQVANPLVSFPFDVEPLLSSLDGIIVTHLHPDHLDAAALERLPKHVPLFCQPCDVEQLTAHGFKQVLPVESTVSWQGISLSRTGGQHGTGEIGQMMGNVAGFVLEATDEPTTYIAGDTIWCEDVKNAIDRFHPSVIAVNAGAAQFLVGDPITMDANDVASVCRYAPGAHILPVHLETWNHCFLTRAALQESLQAAGLTEQVTILADGAVFTR